jgi:hypothetical protein
MVVAGVGGITGGMRRFFLTVSLTLISAAASAQQPVPTPTAATAPAPRFQMVVPPGYEKVAGDGYTAVCLGRDGPWVRQAVKDVKPATRPTTMPADVLKRVTENRAAVVKQMVADLALADDKQPNRFFDESLIPTLRKLEAVRPPLYLLICTREQLRTLVESGWGEPRFRYNRVAQDVSVDDRISLSLDRPMDDTVLPANYDERDAPDARAKRLASQIQRLQSELAQTIANEAQPAVFNRLGQHVDEQYFQPLKLRHDQRWLAMGVAGYLTGKYGAQLTGVPRETWVRMMTYEDRRFPVATRSIDLVHPADEATLRPEAVPLYAQAMRRKAIAAVNRWAAEAGDGAITKVLAAVRASPPADGAALVKLVRERGGVDLSKDLAAQ